MTTAEQLNTSHCLELSFAQPFAIIDIRSSNSPIYLYIFGNNLDLGLYLRTLGPTCDSETLKPAFEVRECLSIVTYLELHNFPDFPIIVFSRLCRLIELSIVHAWFHCAKFGPASRFFGSFRLLIDNRQEYRGLTIRTCPGLESPLTTAHKVHFCLAPIIYRDQDAGGLICRFQLSSNGIGYPDHSLRTSE